MIKSQGATPGRRYGHTISFIKPYLVVFGGQASNGEMQNETWILSVKKMPFIWEKISMSEHPCERLYHTATLCNTGQVAGMLMIFGGRSKEQVPLNDAWGLRKDVKGKSWEWIKAPYKRPQIPLVRYQHNALFFNKSLIVIGGRNNTVGEALQTDIYNTETTEWTTSPALGRFRHSSWINGMCIFSFGGFEQTAPNSPTASMVVCTIPSAVRDPGSIEEGEEAKLSFPKSRPKAAKSTDMLLRNSAVKTAEFRFAPSVLIALSFNQEKSSEQQKTIKSISMGKLQEEAKKLFPEHKPVYEPVMFKEALCNMFLSQLLQPKHWSMEKTPDAFMFKPENIVELANECQRVLSSQPMVVRLKAPVKIFGDIHGQYQDLMRFFDIWGSPSIQEGDIDSYDYLFLGDYVDHGSHCLETICLLMALKVKHPDQVHLLRGNHEDIAVNSVYGFGEECAERLTESMEDPNSAFTAVNSMFEWLPLAATVEDKIICIHAGIGDKVFSIKDLNNFVKPLVIPKVPTTPAQQILTEILWADPCDTDEDLGVKLNAVRDPQGTRKVHRFGSDKVEIFLKANKADYLIRSHECVQDGIERYARGTLITVFSAPAYYGKYKNAGAMLVVQKNSEIIPKLIYPLDKSADWIDSNEVDSISQRKFSIFT